MLSSSQGKEVEMFKSKDMRGIVTPDFLPLMQVVEYGSFLRDYYPLERGSLFLWCSNSEVSGAPLIVLQSGGYYTVKREDISKFEKCCKFIGFGVQKECRPRNFPEELCF